MTDMTDMPDMLLDYDEPTTLVDRIPAWDPRFGTDFLRTLGGFGWFAAPGEDGDYDDMHRPWNDDWKIERSRGKTFVYMTCRPSLCGPPLYHPCFRIFFRDRPIAVIDVAVCRVITVYKDVWDSGVLEGIAASKGLDGVAAAKNLPRDIHGLIQDYLLGEKNILPGEIIK